MHFYNVDMKQLSTHSVFHATSPFSPSTEDDGGLPLNFTYAGTALAEPGRIVNDIKEVNGVVSARHARQRTHGVFVCFQRRLPVPSLRPSL